jgi:hypothetical protein
MEITPYSQRLSSLYANYFDAWRALFGAPAASGPASPLEQREQRWEGEGGSVVAAKPRAKKK